VDIFTSPDLWIAFLTLFALELVLGIDNVVFISILTSRLPPHQQPRARKLGLSLALLLRIALLFVASWIVGLTKPLLSIGDAEALELSGRDLILIAGGAFLIVKAVVEINHALEGDEHQRTHGGASAAFGAIIVQIILIDAVFSIDSVITAVGMVDQLSIMIAAVTLSIGLMMVASGSISGFVNRHPSGKMLALSFRVLIGAALLAEGFAFHIDKPMIYGPIAFATAVELLNLAYRRRRSREPASRLGEGPTPTDGAARRSDPSRRAAPSGRPDGGRAV